MPAGRPKGSQTKTATSQKRTRKSSHLMKTCPACEDIDKATKKIEEFYISESPLHQDGHVPYCKDCIQRLSFDEAANTIDIEAFKKVLMQIDKPYIESALKMAIDQYNKIYEGLSVAPDNRKKIIGIYFQKIHSVKQYKPVKSWEDGLSFNEREIRKNNGKSFLTMETAYDPSDCKIINDERIFSDSDLSKFKVTKEMTDLFGGGYLKSEYKAMWEKYNFLKKSYPDITTLHVEALVTYIRFKVKEERATVLGDVVLADKWNQAATKAADKAKINPSQLSQSDLQGGLNSFSELIMAVEQAVDVIPILPQFKYRPNDAIDFNIWCLINYLRDLEGKPLCSYEDVYAFYDQRKREYIEQYGDPYGIFKDDPTEKNRDSIKKFITLPKGYNNSEGDSS